MIPTVSSLSSLSSQSHDLSDRFSNSNSHISFGSVLRNNLLPASDINGDQSAILLQQQQHAEEGTSSLAGSWQYWCDPCVCGFNKLKSYEQHIQGKRHISVAEEAESLWNSYLESGPAFYDASVLREEVIRAWSLDLFMDGLQARSRSSIKYVLSSTNNNKKGRSDGHGQVDPSIRLCDLTPTKRAALWRYLHTSSVPHLVGMVSVLPDKYVRVKELLESLEVFWHVERLMKRSTVPGQRARKIAHIYDVGCGHGLVGMLCAVAFPHITVHSIDVVSRESFQAQRQAFQSAGVALDNLHFLEGDLSVLKDTAITTDRPTREHHVGGAGTSSSMDDDDEDDYDRHSLLLCIHGCKSLTHESIELAEQNHWSWLTMPCCLQAEHHLDASLSKVSDDTRFAMLCGAIAAKYQAGTVATIDGRITARGIVLTSSSSSSRRTNRGHLWH